ncbi:MAG TPA: hypothetical protein DDY78_22400 [Planctomycetales bacterium]|jgi:hypothetical protein|nr:hypothetical protein [Planctomycetales bacterium]
MDTESANPTQHHPVFATLSGDPMKVVIQMSAREELKALPILLRHSPGMVFPERTYILSEQAVDALRQAGVRFKVL